jgi:hypothetical protein
MSMSSADVGMGIVWAAARLCEAAAAPTCNLGIARVGLHAFPDPCCRLDRILGGFPCKAPLCVRLVREDPHLLVSVPTNPLLVALGGAKRTLW